MNQKETSAPVPDPPAAASIRLNGENVDQGWNAVCAAERAVCGPNLSRSLARAAGLASAGVRTACLVGPQSIHTIPAGERIPIVYQTSQADLVPSSMPLLAAGSHQQAVDLVLAAHLLAQRSGQAVASLLESPLTDLVGHFRLPSPALLEAVFEGPRRIQAAEPTTLSQLQRLSEALFAELERKLKRPCGPFLSDCPGEATDLLITYGACYPAAQSLVSQLRETGDRIGLICLQQIFPFPTEALAEVIEGRSRVWALAPSESVLRDQLKTGVKRACAQVGVTSDLILLPTSPSPTATQLALSLDKSLPAGSLAERADKEGLIVAASPSGDWTRSWLLKLARVLKEYSGNYPLLDRQDELWILDSAPVSEKPSRLDSLVVLPHSGPVNFPEGVELRKGAAILIPSQGLTPEQSWAALAVELRRQLVEKEASLWFLPSVGETWLESEDRQLALLGAFLEISSSRVDLVSATEAVLDNAQLATLNEGRNRALHQTAKDLDLAGTTLAVGSGDDLPLLEAEVEDSNEDLKETLHRFHLTGEGLSTPADWCPDLPLRPAALYLVDDSNASFHYPLYFPEPQQEQTPCPLSRLFEESLSRVPEELSLLSGKAGQLAGVLSVAGKVNLQAALREKVPQIQKLLDPSFSHQEELAQELETFSSLLPSTGGIEGLKSDSLLTFYIWSVARGRKRYREAFLANLRKLLDGLQNLLLAEDARSAQATTPESLDSRVGTQGSRFIDSAALSRVVPLTRGPRSLTPEHRSQLESLEVQLQTFLSEAEAMPLAYLVHSGEKDLQPSTTLHTLCAADSFETAVGLFDGLAARQAAVLRASRRARLEIARTYEPKRHAAALSRIDWQSFSADELLALPPVLVMETSQNLTGRLMTSFGKLLRSARPVQVLIEDHSPTPDQDDLSGSVPELAYLAIAHREALVMQGSLADPVRLSKDVECLVKSLNPAVLVVPVAGGSWLRAAAALNGRLHPVYSYDPSAGDSWASRFSVEGNPESSSRWRQVQLSYQLPDGSRQTLETALTPADSLALDPRFRGHFRVLPPQWESPELVALERYLDDYGELPPETIPFLWVLGPANELLRAIITREMAHLCQDRLRLWKTLQELAGIGNAYVENASQELVQKLTSEFEEKLAATQQQARQAGAVEAINRLARVLTGVEAAPTGEPTATVSLPLPTAPAAAAAEPGAAAAEAAPAAAPDDTPYIDSYLCTTCNECTDRNNRMFKYNDDKQAYLADPTAGSFAELVKAAEACPARCIHPGAPRPDDPTGTEAMKKRAAAFA